MIAVEPHLRADDHRLWQSWRRTFALHARSGAHQRALDDAARITEAALKEAPRPAVMVSWGKDSTVMAHLLRVGMGLDLQVLSEKDDLDFPGERAYAERLAEAWGLRLEILTPPISPAQWITDHAAELDLTGDLHGRAAALSKACFYEVVEAAARPYDGIFLGLRAQESRGRAVDWQVNAAVIDGRRVHGVYQRRTGANAGQWRACPLGSWSGLDVLAYAERHGIELLPLYQCIALMHAKEPWRVRKSWWIPGAASRHGGVAWLAHYWPTLFARLRQWLPRTQGLR